MKTLSKKYKVLLGIFLLVALIGVVTSISLFSKVKTLENPKQTAETKIKDTVAELGKVMVLPTNETPTMATVSDPNKLRSQAFFANAQMGDIVLVYATSKKAILWRPSTKQVVEISGLNTGTQDSTQTGTTGR